MRRGVLWLCVVASPLMTVKAAEVRHIAPPQLSSTHVGQRIVSYCPIRRDQSALFVETRNHKIIAHNYGHGEDGWSLAPGAASYIVGMLETTAGDALTKESPVTIVGAGVFGLFTALHLVAKGYKNITIVAGQFHNLISHHATGLVAPPFSAQKDTEGQRNVYKVSVEAYLFFKKVAKREHPVLKKGAVIIPAYFKNREESRLEPYVKAGVMDAPKDVILDFGNDTQQSMIAYDDAIFVDTGILMDDMKKVLKKRVTFKEQQIKHFNDIPSTFIINCTGMGAKALAQDNKMISAQKYLIMLKDQQPLDLHYMIFVSYGKHTTSTGLPVRRFFCTFPKVLPGGGDRDVGAIGGAAVEVADSPPLNEKEFALILKRAKAFYGIKAPLVEGL